MPERGGKAEYGCAALALAGTPTRTAQKSTPLAREPTRAQPSASRVPLKGTPRPRKRASRVPPEGPPRPRRRGLLARHPRGHRGLDTSRAHPNSPLGRRGDLLEPKGGFTRATRGASAASRTRASRVPPKGPPRPRKEGFTRATRRALAGVASSYKRTATSCKRMAHPPSWLPTLRTRSSALLRGRSSLGGTGGQSHRGRPQRSFL